MSVPIPYVFPDTSSFLSKNSLRITGNVDGAQNPDLARLYALEDRKIPNRKGSNIRPQLRIKALADLREPGEEPKLVGD